MALVWLLTLRYHLRALTAAEFEKCKSNITFGMLRAARIEAQRIVGSGVDQEEDEHEQRGKNGELQTLVAADAITIEFGVINRAEATTADDLRNFEAHALKSWQEGAFELSSAESFLLQAELGRGTEAVARAQTFEFTDTGGDAIRIEGRLPSAECFVDGHRHVGTFDAFDAGTGEYRAGGGTGTVPSSRRQALSWFLDCADQPSEVTTHAPLVGHDESHLMFKILATAHQALAQSRITTLHTAVAMQLLVVGSATGRKELRELALRQALSEMARSMSPPPDSMAGDDWKVTNRLRVIECPRLHRQSIV